MKIYLRRIILVTMIVALLFGVCSVGSSASSFNGNAFRSSFGNIIQEIQFASAGYTNHGDWYAECTVSPGVWDPRSKIKIITSLTVTDEHLA